MSNAKDTHDGLEALAKILLRCTLFGFAPMLLWLGAYFLGGDLMQRQAAMFDLTPHEVGIITYGGVGFIKVCVLLFFLFPYLAIRMILRKRLA